MSFASHTNRHPLNRDICGPREGYDRVADCYDAWPWQEFWGRNEVPLVNQMLPSPVPASRALDIGTGTGRYLQKLRNAGYETCGIDLSPKMLERAAKRFGSFRGLREGDITDIPFPSSSFELIVCCRVLSHVEDIAMAFRECARVLRPGGRAIFADVDGRHNYEATRIPVGCENVWIRVYKHRMDDVVAHARGCGLRVDRCVLIRSVDLLWKPKSQFPTIDWSGKTPISYIVVVTKSGW